MRLLNYNMTEGEKQAIAHHLGQRDGYTLYSTLRTGDLVTHQGRNYILYDHVDCGLGTLAIITDYDVVLEVEWRDIKGASYIRIGSITE